uniref:Uncharacterized protein n=1 Tax=Knipowitschia caucasica TaxID=637954 RepID=A0AAV2MTU0_KNICA
MEEVSDGGGQRWRRSVKEEVSDGGGQRWRSVMEVSDGGGQRWRSVMEVSDGGDTGRRTGDWLWRDASLTHRSALTLLQVLLVVPRLLFLGHELLHAPGSEHRASSSERTETSAAVGAQQLQDEVRSDGPSAGRKRHGGARRAALEEETPPLASLASFDSSVQQLSLSSQKIVHRFEADVKQKWGRWRLGKEKECGEHQFGVSYPKSARRELKAEALEIGAFVVLLLFVFVFIFLVAMSCTTCCSSKTTRKSTKVEPA